jgi:hypothetical protein
MARQAGYDNGPYAHLGEDIMKGFAATAPPNADVNDVARAIVRVVDMPFGKRPFRVHIDPAKTVRRSSTEWQIVFAQKCTVTSDCQIY